MEKAIEEGYVSEHPEYPGMYCVTDARECLLGNCNRSVTREAPTHEYATIVA